MSAFNTNTVKHEIIHYQHTTLTSNYAHYCNTYPKVCNCFSFFCDVQPIRQL